MAVGAHDLDQPELCDVAAHRRLGDLEAALGQQFDELLLARIGSPRHQLADGALALALDRTGRAGVVSGWEAGLAIRPSIRFGCGFMQFSARARTGRPVSTATGCISMQVVGILAAMKPLDIRMAMPWAPSDPTGPEDRRAARGTTSTGSDPRGRDRREVAAFVIFATRTRTTSQPGDRSTIDEPGNRGPTWTPTSLKARRRRTPPHFRARLCRTALPGLRARRTRRAPLFVCSRCFGPLEPTYDLDELAARI